MTTAIWLLILILAAFLCGWLYGQHNRRASSPAASSSNTVNLPQNYFVGLNYLLNEQPDKAVEVFIQMLTVNADTFETHLALGNLFRRRGEVDRAIRVHQNLIARPQLNGQQRLQALRELAQDYLRAGVFDRAERLFLELIDKEENANISLQQLLHIYQQQKDWEQAIAIAEKLAALSPQSLHKLTAQYYCELAQQRLERKQLEQAKTYLQQALRQDAHCVRANLLLGQIAQDQQEYKVAIRHYKQIKQQDPDYLIEALLPMANCFAALQQNDKFMEYLQKCFAQYPSPALVLLLSDYVLQTQGKIAAMQFVIRQIAEHPSLQGVTYLLKRYIEAAQGEDAEKLSNVLQPLMRLLAKQPNYRCRVCGFSARTLYWHCPQCRQWSTLKPILGIEEIATISQ